MNTVTLKINKKLKKEQLRHSRWWVLGRAQIAWSTGCGEKTMNTVTLKINKKFNNNKKENALCHSGGRILLIHHRK